MNAWTLQEFGFTVYFTTDRERLLRVKDEKLVMKFRKDFEDPDTSGLCHKGSNADAYIYIHPDKEISFIDLIDTVSHEVFHAVGFLYEYIDDKTKIRATEEVPAYLQGWLTGEIIKALGYE